MEKQPDGLGISPVRKNNLDALRQKDIEEIEKKAEAEAQDAARKIKEISYQENNEVLKKWETCTAYLEAAPGFLAEAEKCWELYYENHKDSKKHPRLLNEYDQLMDKIRSSLIVFSEEVQKAKQEPQSQDYAEAVMTSEYINIISELCKKVYKIDNSFPDFKLTNEEEYIAAVKKEVGRSDRIKIRDRVGRFAIVVQSNPGSSINKYFILDQQAKDITEKEITNFGEFKNGAAVVSMYSKYLQILKSFLFNAETGKFSEGFESIEPAIGDFWVTNPRRSGPTMIFNKDGKVLHPDLATYVSAKNHKRALIRTGINSYSNYNILLEDGSLLFDGDGMDMDVKSSPYDVIGDSETEIKTDFVLTRDGKSVKLDRNLDIVAEGSSYDEVWQKAA